MDEDYASEKAIAAIQGIRNRPNWIEITEAIRLAILEAMEAQREACVQAWLTVPSDATVRENHLKVIDALRAATVTVKPKKEGK